MQDGAKFDHHNTTPAKKAHWLQIRLNTPKAAVSYLNTIFFEVWWEFFRQDTEIFRHLFRLNKKFTID